MAYIRPPNTIIAGRALKQNPEPSPLDPAGVLKVNIDANIASKTELGVVKVGDNIDVTADGIISVTFPTGPYYHGCKVISVSDNYNAQLDDYYIGVTSTKSVTIFLPENPPDCVQIIVKADMPSPIGNKKVIIKAAIGNFIDDEPSVELTIPYESLSIISQGQNWHKI